METKDKEHMSTAIFYAIERNDINTVKKLLTPDIINSKDELGYSFLHTSLAKVSDEMSIFLIDNGINVNLKDKNGQTALHYAALFNKIEIANLLLKKGADINIEDNYGNQPLWTAVLNDKGFGTRLELIKLFISHGAGKDHKNKADKSPRDFAQIANFTEVLTILN